MTTTVSDPTPTRTPPRLALDRWALAVLLPIGPLAIAVIRAILPYYTTDSNTAAAAAVAAHQSKETAVLWLTFIASLTMVPAVIAVGLIARRRSPWIGTIALLLSVAGFMSLFGPSVTASDYVSLGAAKVGMAPATAGGLIDAISALPPVSVAGTVFVVGHVLGVVLLGIALWRGRVIAPWAALLLTISQLLHLTFAVFVPSHLLDGVSWGLTALGFAAVGIAVVRTPRERSQG